MKVSKQIFELSEKILNTFDAQRLKQQELDKIKEKEIKVQEKLDNIQQSAADGNSKDPFNYDKWELLDKQINLEETKTQVAAKDYSQETMMKEMMGCSRDHSKEIDIYNKSYKEKIERIQQMKDQGNKSYFAAEYDKASYYYAQALLIFYYLIPDTPQEETESNELKRLCHMNQSLCYIKLMRFKDALQEIDLALKINKNDFKSLLRKASILLELTEFEKAIEIIEERILTLPGKESNQEALKLKKNIKDRMKEYQQKSKDLYEKMINQNDKEKKEE